MTDRPEVGYPRYEFTFDAEAVTAFTDGDCGYLALELSVLTGWIPITASIDVPHEWTHAAVLTPAGDVLDIHGVTMPDEWLERWTGGHPGEEHYIHEWNDTAFAGEVRRYAPAFPEYWSSRWARKVMDAYNLYLTTR